MNFDKLRQFAIDHVAGDRDGFREDFCTLCTVSDDRAIRQFVADLEKLLLSYGVDPKWKGFLFGISLDW